MSYINKNDTRKNWTYKRLILELESIEDDIKSGELTNMQAYRAKIKLRELQLLIKIKRNKIEEFVLDRYDTMC